MTANNISSGRSCERTVSELFMERIGGFGSGDFNIEYFIHGDNTENGWRLSLTIYSALVRAMA